MSQGLSIEDIKKLMLNKSCPIVDRVSHLEKTVISYIDSIAIKEFDLVDYNRMNSNDMLWITEKHKECIIKQNIMHMLNSYI